MNKLLGHKPERVLYYFEQLCAIPHGSGNCGAVSEYCVTVATELGLPVMRDKWDNVIITKPASEGYEHHEPVILQGHLDMVCEKDADCAIDFEKDVIEKIRAARFNGFTHYMIVVAEGAGSASEIANKIKESIDLDPRVTVLGHIQRGGCPTGRDRVNATKMGYLAVEMLLQGKNNRIICTHQGTFTDVDIDEALSMKKHIQKMEVDVLAAMTGI